MDTTTLTQKIKERAHELGFPLAGVTTPDPPLQRGFLQNWLQAGYQASMDWIGTDYSLESRADPRVILPECRSILVLGSPYSAPRGNVGGGNIAAYALNQDYHDVLGKRLQALVEAIEDWVGEPVPNRWYTDTGPVLEKELAMRAGLGWIGKNTILINKEYGSYFFLAEILLGIELIIDPPVTENYCGDCTRCLVTCPTGALREPYTLDANRCISYLTIEHRGEIPEGLRSRIGDWIFGCDICQLICPWNKPGQEASNILEEFRPREEILEVDLIEELGLCQEEFSTRFKGSPVKRAKRRGYLRNVAIALGNRGEEDALPALEKALEAPEPLIRKSSAWALGKIGGERTSRILQKRLKDETDPGVIRAIQDALGEQ
ncbi:MAG: tRNA epoxyqueuosine(34) reductase QueG [Chloroflexi bacterium]|nr:MAG: tRNA epoxyqueuosine(34) reductase QueG [Chloroflexota bacterium]